MGRRKKRRLGAVSAGALLLFLVIFVGGVHICGNVSGEQIQAAGKWLVQDLWNQAAFSSKNQTSEKKNMRTNPDPDPAYRAYRNEQDFYAEHEYLAWYGAEESGQTAQEENVESPETTNDAAQTAQASVNAGGLAGSISRPAIGTTYRMEQLADYDYLMQHFYNVHTSTTASRDQMSAQTMAQTDLSLPTDAKSPQILIYHTHSQEAFADSKTGETVVALGERLTKLLEEKGYGVLHDTTAYDMAGGSLDRSKAYTYALSGITKILEDEPQIQVVLDLHRDGVGENVHLVTQIDGEPTAQIMFFNGMSQTPEGPIAYLENPYLAENLAFSFQMELGAQAYYPGFTRKIYLKGLRYNLHLRARSALVEVGAQTNTFAEALRAMQPLSELLHMVLRAD